MLGAVVICSAIFCFICECGSAQLHKHVLCINYILFHWIKHFNCANLTFQQLMLLISLMYT